MLSQWGAQKAVGALVNSEKGNIHSQLVLISCYSPLRDLIANR